MPRKKNTTMSGAPAAPAAAPVGVPYGEGERALESQRRMPVPDFADAGGPTPPGGAEGGAAGGGEAPDRLAQVLQMARDQIAPSQQALSTPSNRPQEPVTQGLPGSSRPLPVDPITNAALYELRAIAKRTGYPEFLQLLARAEAEM